MNNERRPGRPRRGSTVKPETRIKSLLPLNLVIDTVAVARRLEETRDSKGWTGQDFAKAAGLVEKTHYAQLIRNLRQPRAEGRRMGGAGIETIARLAIASGQSLDWLVLGKGELQ